MSKSALILDFRNDETLRGLERAAEALGVSKNEFAETVIERALATIDIDFEGRLVRTLERLKSYEASDLERDIWDFARSEVEYQDPLQARYVETKDTYGIGARTGVPSGTACPRLSD